MSTLLPSSAHRMDGQLEFWDTFDMTLMNSQEHSMATDLEWDPTGRYAVTSVSYWSQKVCRQSPLEPTPTEGGREGGREDIILCIC